MYRMPVDYFTDNEVYTSKPLPTPSDTPYRTPSFQRSRPSTGHDTPISSPLSPNGDDIADERDAGKAENISPLDPRRFTPTLHASLVSEILSLRRELDSKHDLIDRLEANLDSAKTENENLQEKSIQNAKESRSIKKQLQSIEVGTLSAIEELCKERDEANKANSDLKKRLEVTQKNVKTHEEQAEQHQVAWERENLKWQKERRALERKVYVSESRLRGLVAEIQSREDVAQADLVDDNIDSGLGNESDTGSVHSSKGAARGHNRQRSGSLTDLQRLRLSHVEGAEPIGVSLADELGSDDENGLSDEDALSEQERNLKKWRTSRLSRDLKRESLKGMPSLLDEYQEHPETIAEEIWPGARPDILSKPVTTEKSDLPGPNYVDTGVQFTPPDTPHLGPQLPLTLQDQTAVQPLLDERDVRGDKAPELQHDPHRGYTESAQFAAGDVRPVRTWDGPSNPPDYLGTFDSAVDEGNFTLTPKARPELVSASTQTDPIDDARTTPLPPSRAPPPLPVVIPSIVIHHSASPPSSPREAVLPPATRSAACQTEMDQPVSTCSIGMQTEAIRADKRPVKLPPQLLSSYKSGALTPDRSNSKTARDLSPVLENSAESKRQRPLKLFLDRDMSPTPPLNSPEFGSEDRYSENDADDMYESRKRLTRLGKPFKPYSRPKGGNAFDYDYYDELGSLDLSDGEYDAYGSMAKKARKLQRQGRHFIGGMPFTVPEDEKDDTFRPYHRSKLSAGSRNSLDRSNRSSKQSAFNITYKDSRRSVLSIKSGSTDKQRSRSPSVASDAASSCFSKGSGPAPPFPIPSRRSSAGIGAFKSGSSSPTAHLGRDGQNSRQSRRLTKEPRLRKVRSANSIPNEREQSPGKQSTAPSNFTTNTVGSSIPPVPKLNLSNYHQSGRTSSSRPSTSRYQPFSAVTPTGNACAGGSAQHSVVDAITVSMVGEWMWKYVRKRTNFGVGDSAQDYAKTGDSRHKRWVWLSPYERTIMWSSKQPTSNAALLGKNGRRVVIQSVLDVKDETPLPRGSSVDDVFNRSILVLTTARALKFTATTMERHYLWLTALSFLSQHNSTSIADLTLYPYVPAPPLNGNESRSRSNTASLRRTPIWDSRRITKDRTRSGQSSGYATPTIPSGEHNGSIHSNSGSTVATIQAAPTLDKARIPDVASAPTIPRLPASTRKKSFPGFTPSEKPAKVRKERPPPPSLRSKSSNAAISSATTTAAHLSGPPSTASVVQLASTSPSSPVLPDHQPNTTDLLKLPAEASPRPSTASASFGGNNNFFDAAAGATAPGDNFPMQTFVRPGMPRGMVPASQESLGTAVPGRRSITSRGWRKRDKEVDPFCGFG